MGNCFRCYFKQLFISLTLRICKKDCKIPKIILVQGFRPLKSGFRLNNSFSGVELESVFKIMLEDCTIVITLLDSSNHKILLVFT